MAKFQFAVLTDNPERKNVITAKLGARAGNATELKAGLGEYSDAEINKAVKIGPVSNYLLCAAGDEIDGVIDNIDSGGTEDGFTLGGVARCNAGQRYEAEVGTGSAQLAVGDLVVAAAQKAVGTPGLLQVQKGTPTLHVWRVMRIITGTGVVGNKVLIEKL